MRPKVSVVPNRTVLKAHWASLNACRLFGGGTFIVRKLLYESTDPFIIKGRSSASAFCQETPNNVSKVLEPHNQTRRRKGTQKMQNNNEFIIKPKVDFCFKELMEDAEIRRGFISAILDVKPEEIAETELLPTFLRKTSPEEKYGILDVHVRIIGEHAGEMDIEIQVAPYEVWADRSLFYLCKMFHSPQIQEGQEYGDLKKCIHVGILDFVLFEENEEYYSCFHLWDDDHRRKYTDKLEIHIVELPKWNHQILQEGARAQRPELQNWARFLHAEMKEELEIAANADSYVEKAYERLLYISMDEEKRREYEAREKAIRDYNSQMASNRRKGRVEGELLKEISLIQENLEEGLTIEEVAKFLKKPAVHIHTIRKWLEKHPDEKEAEQHLKELQKDLDRISVS